MPPLSTIFISCFCWSRFAINLRFICFETVFCYVVLIGLKLQILLPHPLWMLGWQACDTMSWKLSACNPMDFCLIILKARGLKCISLVENQGLGSIVLHLEALEKFSFSPFQPPETACVISSPHLTSFFLCWGLNPRPFPTTCLHSWPMASFWSLSQPLMIPMIASGLPG